MSDQDIDIAIKVENVTKRFKIYHNMVLGPIKEYFLWWNRDKHFQEFIAVKNVNMTVKRGEVVGIIGSNGAGKTTLLKMIAGLLPVNSGNIQVNGKITALLALGIGFNPEFSGRENIYYSGLLLGMTKAEVKRKMDSIIEFAEIGNFIEKPIRTYSSGMKARLLFATSMSIDPDILIVDEALATGDAYFIQKSSAKIRDFVNSGATILFVSHNLRQIEQLCDRTYLMEKGELIEEGDSREMVKKYNQLVFKDKAKQVLSKTNPDLILQNGTGDIILTDIKMKNDENKVTNAFHSGSKVYMFLHYKNIKTGNLEAYLVMNIFDTHNHEYISQVSTYRHIEKLGQKEKKTKISLSSTGEIVVEFENMLLLNNKYYFRIVIIDAIKPDLVYCEYTNVSPFFISRKDNAMLNRGSDAIFWHPFKVTTINQ